MDPYGEFITVSSYHRPEGQALTRQEEDTLKGLVGAIERYGNPSLKEIAVSAGTTATGTGYYPPTIHRYLRSLEEKGYVKLPPRYSCRGRIQVLKRG